MNNERQLALIDVDNTLYDGYIILSLTEQLKQEGLLNPGAKERIDASLILHHNGTLDYETFAELALIYWAAGLAGKKESDITKFTQTFLLTEGDKFFPETRPLLDCLKQTHDIYLVTAEPDFVSSLVQQQLGLQGHVSTSYEVVEGQFTGRVTRSLGKKEAERNRWLITSPSNFAQIPYELQRKVV